MLNNDTTYIFYTDISKLNNEKFKQFLDVMPESRKMNVDTFAFDEDKRRYVFSFGLLYKCLKQFGLDTKDYRYVQDIKGKPYFDKCPFRFNMSHSGKYVAVCFSTSEVGIDIQEVTKKDYADLIPILMTDEEIEHHESLKESEKHLNFFRLWNKKESYLKYTGNGLSKSMKSFDADHPEVNTNIFTISLNDKYYLSCCYLTNNIEAPQKIEL